MATIVLSSLGAAVGGAIGGTVLGGLTTAGLGRAIGATFGRAIDQSWLGGSEPVETGKIERLRLTGAGEGRAIAQVYGRMRCSGHVIWASRFRETTTTVGGGKGVPRQPDVTQYAYSISLAVAVAEGPVARIGRIWADGTEIVQDDYTIRKYLGDETQAPDPTIEAIEGAAPAFRGIAYVLFEDLPLARFGNRVPQLSFEVIGVGSELAQSVRAVALMPGTGEYALATTPVYIPKGVGNTPAINVNAPSGATDFVASLEALTTELPGCGAVNLIVSWFGDDLRCDRCKITPRVEHQNNDPSDMPWQVAGGGRSTAQQVPISDAGIVYGGTPSDQTVQQAVEALKRAGQAVMFYPFVLMTQMPENDLTNPWDIAARQPKLPWRGRITLSAAPGQPGSPDQTSHAANEVDNFFGTAKPSDFSRSSSGVTYTGPEDHGYRRFILHYAHLCAAAGGVDAFCIGSELRGLTQIRDASGFPAVEQLRLLAADVREILGSDTKIGYAADWSEYFGYHPQDGSNDVYFHLDPLWADPNIDFVGIDNYMPLSDWRDADDHADQAAKSIYDLGYLQNNILHGEGYEWYYPSTEARQLQDRRAITDEAYDEAWVFRYKDLPNWWSHRHHERINGVRSTQPTAWVPQSKPIWFTEFGCPAVDKGTNQPNKFIDPKSSESALPYFSTGQRDDLIQQRYIQAVMGFWSDPANNPISERYNGPMIDLSRAFVWAWDARPYPHFPSSEDLWRDAPNYRLGHWISGRASHRDLGGVLRDICAKSGVEQVNTQALHSLLRGYRIDQIAGARAHIQPMLQAYGVDAVERDGGLNFIGRAFASKTEIKRDEVVARDGRPDIEATRAPQAEVSGRLQVTYVGEAQDFAAASAQAIMPGAASRAIGLVDLPLLLTTQEAQSIVERWLAEATVARESLALALPPSRREVGPGDLVQLDKGLFRVDRLDLSHYQELELTRVDPQAYHQARRAAPAVSGKPLLAARYIAPSPVLSTLLDLPMMRGDEGAYAPYLAATAKQWPGGVALYRSVENDGYRQLEIQSNPAIMGESVNELAQEEVGRFDRGKALIVRLAHGALSSISEQALLAGGNLMAIGSQQMGWELFQFQYAELVARATYALRHRLRGQAGTDGVMPPTWPAGSQVVLINQSVKQVDLAPNLRNLKLNYRIGPIVKPVSDPIYTQHNVAIAGVGLRPYRPCHLRATRLSDGEIRFTWIRRTRIEGDDWAPADVPLGESEERYRIEIRREDCAVHSFETTQTHWDYRQSDLVCGSAKGPFCFAVAQISERFGPGPFAKRIIPDT